MTTIRVVGSSTEVHAEPGKTLLEALQAAGVPISTSCGGRASCGLCRLTVVRGRELLSPLLGTEITHIGNVAKVVGIRLACQARVLADGEIEVDVPPVRDVVGRKRAKAHRSLANGPRGAAGNGADAAAPSGPAARVERIEWRPRKLAGAGSTGPSNPSTK